MSIENLKYKLNVYFSAMHHFERNGIKQNDTHPHTWEVKVVLYKQNDNVLNFKEVEESIDSLLSNYDGKILNNMSQFKGKDPTLEEIGFNLAYELSNELESKNIVLKEFEIGESPLRTFFFEEEDLKKIRKNAHKSICSDNILSKLNNITLQSIEDKVDTDKNKKISIQLKETVEKVKSENLKNKVNSDNLGIFFENQISQSKSKNRLYIEI